MARDQVRRFQEMVRRREGLLHFGEMGTLLADTPEAALDHLFGRLVERQFAQDFKDVSGLPAVTEVQIAV
jgi:hypothetical protein